MSCGRVHNVRASSTYGQNGFGKCGTPQHTHRLLIYAQMIVVAHARTRNVTDTALLVFGTLVDAPIREQIISQQYGCVRTS